LPHINVNTLPIYYEIHGQGMPLIMIRGIGSNADHWYKQVPLLAKKYRVVAFDNRGIARSSDHGVEFSIWDMAIDTLGLMDALKVEKAHILGLSMGGMVAQEIAIAQPERVLGLILACTHPGGSKQIRPTNQVLNLFSEFIRKRSQDSWLKAAPFIFDPYTLSKRPNLVSEYIEKSRKYSVDSDILLRQWRAILTHDTYSRLGKIKSPTLVLTGDRDVLIPPDNSKLLVEKIAQSRLVVIPGGGHQILIEQPELCNHAIIDFLDGLCDLQNELH
jgi:3-oxoadipate enol-lactonase